MSIVRLNIDEVFSTDSQEYDILINAAEKVGESKVPGAILEIGTRRGGSAKMIMDALAKHNSTDRLMICIDPYGNIEIPCTNLNMAVHYPNRQVEGDPTSKEITTPQRFDYTNTMRNRVIPSLYYYAYQAGFNFQFMCLEDTEFFQRYADGVPTYNEHKEIVNTYALVFFDGPHDNKSLQLEVDFFIPRSTKGTMFIFDDIWMMHHDEVIESKLFANDFKLVQKGKIKASYMKVK